MNSTQTGSKPDARQADEVSDRNAPGMPNVKDDKRKPGDGERPMTDDENLDEALDETFPASDPISPSRIDGPNN